MPTTREAFGNIHRHRFLSMHRRFVWVFMLIGFAGGVKAQQSHVPPKVSAKAEKALGDGQSLISEGRFEEGIARFEALIARYPTWLAPREVLARAQYGAGHRRDAINTIEAALAIDTLSQLPLLLTLGRLLEEESDWVRARACYAGVIRNGVHAPALVEKATAALQAFEGKRHLFRDDTAGTLTPMADGINSPGHEALGRWTLDARHFIFTRLVDGQEDIYFATLDSTSYPVKTEPWAWNTAANEGAHALSPDGRYFIFTACDQPDGSGSCDLYMAVLRGEFWAQPRNLGAPVNGPSWEGQPCFGLDGRTLYFSSSRPGGYGGRDIWFATERAPGKWSVPVNAGPKINTAADEESPYVHFDGGTLYFMRNGRDGLGGYDLYIARLGLDGRWRTAENMGTPVNSGADEGALSLHPDGLHAVITRLTETRKNDLFVFALPEKHRAAPAQALRVALRDAATGLPVKGQAEIFEVVDFDTVRLLKSADDQGKLAITLLRAREYGLLAVAEGYFPRSLDLPPDAGEERSLLIDLDPVSADSATVVFENILFESGSAMLLPAAAPEIQQIVQFLRTQPAYHAEIRGHTDDVGRAEDNQILSETRAMAVRNELGRLGIDTGRLTAHGLGESQPITDNADELGRRRNRRTEIRFFRPR